MSKIYRLKRDGQLVHTFRSTVTTVDGREEHLTRGEVGHAGQEFTDLPPHVTGPIDAGEMDDIWEVVEVPDEDEEAAAPSEVIAPVTPVSAARSRRPRATSLDEDE